MVIAAATGADELANASARRQGDVQNQSCFVRVFADVGNETFGIFAVAAGRWGRAAADRCDHLGPGWPQGLREDSAGLGHAADVRLARAGGFPLRGQLFGPLAAPVGTADRVGDDIAAVTFARPAGEVQRAVAVVPVGADRKHPASKRAVVFGGVLALANSVAATEYLVDLVQQRTGAT